MLNLVQACALGYDGNYEPEEVLNDYDERCVDDLDYDDISCIDYMNIGLYNEDTKEVYFIDDNIHRKPEEVINGFCLCLNAMKIEYNLTKKVIDWDEK